MYCIQEVSWRVTFLTSKNIDKTIWESNNDSVDILLAEKCFYNVNDVARMCDRLLKLRLDFQNSTATIRSGIRRRGSYLWVFFQTYSNAKGCDLLFLVGDFN